MSDSQDPASTPTMVSSPPVTRPGVVSYAIGWFGFSSVAWTVAAICFIILLAMPSGSSAPDKGSAQALIVIAVIGLLATAVLSWRCFWIATHLPRREPAVWEAVKGQAIIGCLCLFPLGVLLNLPVLIQWDKPETLRWFGVGQR